jgi:hypothetical protein
MVDKQERSIETGRIRKAKRYTQREPEFKRHETAWKLGGWEEKGGRQGAGGRNGPNNVCICE